MKKIVANEATYKKNLNQLVQVNWFVLISFMLPALEYRNCIYSACGSASVQLKLFLLFIFAVKAS